MAASDMPSPPVRPTVHDRLGIFSSSPSLPDLRDLVAARPKPKPQTIRSGSAAAPIPTAASTTFTSASELLRLARATGDDSFDVIDEPEPPVAKKAPAKRARKASKEPKVPKDLKPAKAPKPQPKKEKAPKRIAKEVIVLSSDGVTPICKRHEELDATSAGAQDDDAAERQEHAGTPLKAKPWKKFKATISPDRSSLPQGEAKVSAKPKVKAKSQKKSKAETVSRHFAKEKDSVEPEIAEAKKKRPKAAKASTPEPINLEPAVQRRADWTPVKLDTPILQSSPDQFATPEDLLTTNADGTAKTATDACLFEKLRDTYGHKSADEDASSAPTHHPGQVLGKRKVIEMVSVNASTKATEKSGVPSPAKAKAPKKKPRTITELATAVYAPQVTEDIQKEDSVLEYFSIEGPEQDAPDGAAAAKEKGKAKTSKVTKSRKKVLPKKSVLLSPKAAIMQSAAQDFVFGTASQLACEQSPTFLRDLHAAMKASTEDEEKDPFGSPLTTKNSKSKPPGKSLWSVSTRDEGGELVNVESIDIINSPALPQDDAILNPRTDLPPEAAGAGSVMEIDSGLVATPNADKVSQEPIPKSHFFMTQKLTIQAAAAMSPKIFDDSLPLTTDLLEYEMPPPSNQQQIQEEVRHSPSKVTASPQKSRPKYESFTDAKLAQEVSKFGFKAVKTRTGMIALLDRCWKSSSEASVTGATFAATSILASPKRKEKDAAIAAPATSPPTKKPRSKLKTTVDADDGDAEASKAAQARTGAATLDDTPATPKRKPGRPRKDAAVDVVKKKLGRPRKDAVAGENAAVSMPPPPKPKTAPSTPKRVKAAAQPIRHGEQLDLDSEIEASGSSPEQLFTPDGTDADVTISEDTEISLNMSPTDLHSTMFRSITKAVTSAPRTTDPQNPSWHEKMLMYDPIILEDLTAWLNSGQLTKVGHDDEVSLHDVKKWCESRSICCLGKETWRGTERKRL